MKLFDAEIERLRAALAPFAAAYEEWSGIACDHLNLRQMHDETPGETDRSPITFADLRRAHEVLKK